MGYYSDFEISEASADVKEALKKKSGYSWYSDELNEAKWYDWREDLETVSKNYPSSRLVLTITGEESGDFKRAILDSGSLTFLTGRVVFD